VGEEDGYIEAPKLGKELRQKPYPLPKEFEWTIVDVNDPIQVSILFHRFLSSGSLQIGV
jgi:glycylpeptide N-tetradecanoyltransferase